MSENPSQNSMIDYQRTFFIPKILFKRVSQKSRKIKSRSQCMICDLNSIVSLVSKAILIKLHFQLHFRRQKAFYVCWV